MSAFCLHFLPLLDPSLIFISIFYIENQQGIHVLWTIVNKRKNSHSWHTHLTKDQLNSFTQESIHYARLSVLQLRLLSPPPESRT